MPHVDEGILHAYLDGALDALHDDNALPDAMTPADVLAHLDACADCRARLDIERDIRERAGMVLRDASPAVHTPPIESLSTARRAAPWVPYAWAASLVMAVGAGWWGSQIAGERGMNSLAVQEAASVAQDAAAPPAAPAPMPEAPAEAETVAPPTSDVGAAARTNPQPSGFGSAEKTVATGTPPPVAAAEARVSADAAQGRIAGVQTLQQSPTRQQQSFDTTPVRQQVGDLTRGTVMVTPAAPPPPPASVTPIDRFVRALDLMRAEGFAWRAATAADSIVAYGIVGATNTRVEVARAPDIGDIARVRQRLADGRDIEVVQWPQPARPRREETRAANAANTIVASPRLDDGTSRIVLEPPPRNALIALIVVGTDAVALAQALTIIRP